MKTPTPRKGGLLIDGSIAAAHLVFDHATIWSLSPRDSQSVSREQRTRQLGRCLLGLWRQLQLDDFCATRHGELFAVEFHVLSTISPSSPQPLTNCDSSLPSLGRERKWIDRHNEPLRQRAARHDNKSCPVRVHVVIRMVAN